MSRSFTYSGRFASLVAAASGAFAAAFGSAQGQPGPVPSFGPDIRCVGTLRPLAPKLESPGEHEVYEILVQRDWVTVNRTHQPGGYVKNLVTAISFREKAQSTVCIQDRVTWGKEFKLFLHDGPGQRRTGAARVGPTWLTDLKCELHPEGSLPRR